MSSGIELGRVRRLSEFIATWVFVDGVWIHRFWHCHRLPERSFFVKGRQFHVCARCTGLMMGATVSTMLLGTGNYLILPFLFFASLLALDGFTQRQGYRNSNNRIRFIIGLTTGLTALPAIVTALGGL
jgi:uncharacterized membrane protein